MIEKRLEELKKPEAYPFEVQEIKMIQTHTSWVFLTGNYAYKIKKPVKFSFLDYSTMGRRKFFCEREIFLNKRLSSDVYLDIVNVTDDNALFFEGKGKTVDYAVKMKQLPENKRMDLLLEQKKVSTKQVLELAGIMNNFHQNIPTIKEKNYGSPEFVFKHIKDLSSIRSVVEKELSQEETLDKLIKKCKNFVEKNNSFIKNRKKNGFVKECHGDFYSKNVFLTDEIKVFDCIEFNNDINFTDIVTEIAFMSMDLDAFNERKLSKKFVNHYIELSGDKKGFSKLLNLYKSYRANVRSKVAGLAFLQLKDEKAKEEELDKVEKYLHLASEYAEFL